MSIVIDCLSKISPLSKESGELLDGIFVEKQLPKSTLLIKQGLLHNKIYILIKGIVRSYITDKNGKENVRSFFSPVSYFTALPSGVKSKPSSSSFETLTHVVLYEANFKDFIKLTHDNHDVSILYSTALEEAFDRMLQRMINLSTLDATERYIDLKKRAPNIEQLIPLYQIASYLNITPIQFSRIRKKLYSS